MLQLHSSHGKLAHESSELKIVLEHEAVAGDFFLFSAANWEGDAKYENLVLRVFKKVVFPPGMLRKKMQLYWYMLKRLNLNTVFTQIRAAALIQKMLIL